MGIPVVVDGLDDEAEGGADRVDILAHDLLDNRRLARIVEAAALRSARTALQVREEGCISLQHQDAQLLVLESRLAQD